ncbi:LytR C-terminal domain-containing protein [Ruania zhangjianzhongii]|uniref:LytR C-terminal domain-containing protein n=1 Tax=Ruania zhangjianzhongii TaxID=2603206 RepID=UPI0011C8B29F|nr:LytR C-terminal domain-containing protein [Ruania zhangjianzhongii]
MSKQPYAYDEDEFDALGADRVPVGVHRRPVPWWRHALPFLVVLVLAPILAFGVVQIWSQEAGPNSDPTPTAGADDSGADGSGDTGGEEPSGEGTDETGESDADADASESPEEETTPEDDLDRDLGVWILNGSATVGLAGEAASQLEADDWTNIDTADYSNELPTESAVFYTTAEMAEEAEAIGEALGIGALYEDPEAASNGVVIVLRSDFEQ